MEQSESAPINLDQLSSAHKYQLNLQSREHESERDARLRTEERDAAHQRWRDSVSFALTIAVVVSLVAAAAWVSLVAPSPDPEIKRWAARILDGALALLAGKIGFDIRKHTAR